MHGEGEFHWPDNRKYKGNYENNKKSGVGEFEWADGQKYIGNWKNGL